MRVRPFRTLACLLLGVASTYVVAATAVKLADWRVFESEISAVKDGDWYHSRYRTPGYDRYKSETTAFVYIGCFGPSLPPDEAFERPFEVYPDWRTQLPELDSGRRSIQLRHCKAAGFPFRCFTAGGRRSSVGFEGREDTDYFYVRGDWGFTSAYSSSAGTFSFDLIFRVPPELDLDRDGDGLLGIMLSIPIDPLPMPFLINSMLYSGFWAFVVPAPFRLRRSLRRRAGRCIGCKYDLTGLPDDEPCPECGRVGGRPVANATDVSQPSG